MGMAQTVERLENDGTAPDVPPLRLSRVFRARRETVFRAWGSAEHVKRWFAPEGCDVAEAAVEMRVGGKFELNMRSPCLENWLRGTFVEIVPNERLVLDMRIEDGDGAPLFSAYTELNFTDVPGGTRLDVTQTYTLIDLSKAWMLQGAPQGWNSTLDNLEREVQRMEVGG
jgi:uncharacterized protein YndB with AHSA1/START domain